MGAGEESVPADHGHHRPAALRQPGHKKIFAHKKNIWCDSGKYLGELPAVRAAAGAQAARDRINRTIGEHGGIRFKLGDKMEVLPVTDRYEHVGIWTRSTPSARLDALVKAGNDSSAEQFTRLTIVNCQ